MYKILASLTLLLLPIVTFAQLFESGGDFESSTGDVLTFINGTLVPLIFGLALLFFLWGVLLAFVIKRDEDSRSEGKQYMVWAVLGLVVMVSLWGIVNLLAGALGLEGDSLENIPDAPDVIGGGTPTGATGVGPR